MTSIFSLPAPAWTPPAALISAMASLAPSRIEVPMGAEPPLNGPVIATLRESAAKAGRARTNISREANLVIGMDLWESRRSGAREGTTAIVPPPDPALARQAGMRHGAQQQFV